MEEIVFNNCKVYYNNKFSIKSLNIVNGKLKTISNKPINKKGVKTYDCNGLIAIPGLIDIHTHLREPGYEYKETIKTGTMAAAAGGYTTICCMPNVLPAPDSVKNIKLLLNLIKKDALINVYSYACITKGRKIDTKPVDISSLSKYCFAFSNDGSGVEFGEQMKSAMKQAQKCSKPIVAHAEDLCIIPPKACVHNGNVAKRFNLVGIPSISEWKQVERDCELAIKTKCQYHVCHYLVLKLWK